ncbi:MULTISPECIES: integration host factor subunit beta [Rhizobium]|uniref:Integration host factor subunit beta n=4 Tax=Rhizobium TaxID=379 RepID=A0A6P1CL77_RHITR|nr:MULTISPECIES: integration host factor subunit beta [Rhizobium]AGB73373.1 integration host factor, beta subunit [Rhizobium tropici CIAT 899]AYG70323.1 integration host factor subunit beta [Rhizobium sp. CCGE531]AYG76710.1 integration host factor subunit beta [Rhizobium sp. CCGE532]ENN86680.1 integration host factor, beta subunit [Rhizobium freirei PRF 81]MBB4245617.1 integration host factor subunit beta [Rhizobium tropici]
MIKSELIEIVAHRRPFLHLKDAERIVDAILEEMAEALMRGDRVELRGFGAFSVRHRLSKSGRNPKTNTSIFVEEKWVPFFKAGKDIQYRLNAASNLDARRIASRG